MSNEAPSVRKLLPPSTTIYPSSPGAKSPRPGDMSQAAAISKNEAAPLQVDSEAAATVLQHKAVGRSKQCANKRASTSKATKDGSRFSLFSRFRPEPILQLRIWEEYGQIDTSPPASYPSGIASHPNGGVAVTSGFAPVTVFSLDGVHVIKGSPNYIWDIAITSTSQYIIPGNRGSKALFIYNSDGVLLNTIPTYDINNKPSVPTTVAVDSTGRIIVGLGYDNHKTVSIHQPDGTLISQFETPLSPRKLTCTPDDRLIISFDDNTLQVMEQSGHKARIIQPPPCIQSWNPWYVCCSKQGELFVGNTGIPSGVYRYVSPGRHYKYRDCITRMDTPRGITISVNEEELFVVHNWSHIVKIFK